MHVLFIESKVGNCSLYSSSVILGLNYIVVVFITLSVINIAINCSMHSKKKKKNQSKFSIIKSYLNQQKLNRN